jgi:hypothetical protein
MDDLKKLFQINNAAITHNVSEKEARRIVREKTLEELKMKRILEAEEMKEKKARDRQLQQSCINCETCIQMMKSTGLWNEFVLLDEMNNELQRLQSQLVKKHAVQI